MTCNGRQWIRQQHRPAVSRDLRSVAAWRNLGNLGAAVVPDAYCETRPLARRAYQIIGSWADERSQLEIDAKSMRACELLELKLLSICGSCNVRTRHQIDHRTRHRNSESTRCSPSGPSLARFRLSAFWLPKIVVAESSQQISTTIPSRSSML